MAFQPRAQLRRRLGWSPVEATLIDGKFVEHGSYNASKDANQFQVWDYMVELPSSDGSKPKRLVIREKTFKVDLPEMGEAVPVLVNRSGTKAMFDLRDPRIDAVGKFDRRIAARQARDEARFEEKLKE